MKLPIKDTRPAIVAAFAALPVPADEPSISCLSGNLEGHILLLCEHPDDEELRLNAPMASEAGRLYANLFHQAEFDVNNDLLILAYSRFGKKPNKASTKDTFPFLVEWLPKTRVKCVAAIGMLAFGHVFAGGRKTHARSIIGNPMYLPQLHSLPVFVLPDTTAMIGINPKSYRDVNFAKEKEQNIFQCLLKLKAFVSQI